MIAKYIEVDGKAFVLEMVTKITDDALFSAYGESEFAKTIAYYNKKIFLDPLTNTYNRRYFEEQLKEVVHTSAVAMVDVDNFKIINDTYGHQIGDAALCKVAELLSLRIADKGHIVRFGGDEFLLVFAQIDQKAYRNTLEAIKNEIYATKLSETSQVQLSISIGAVYCESYRENVIAEADQMLYKAKKEKNKVVFGKLIKLVDNSVKCDKKASDSFFV